MSSCCDVHKDILSEFPYRCEYNLSNYQEHEQNRIFIIVNETLLIIDSTNYVRMCLQCKKQRSLYTYGDWPDVRASFDGVTDLPICAIVHDIKSFVHYTRLYNEPSFGKFIYLFIEEIFGCDMIIYTHGDIERKPHRSYQNMSIDGIPAICCKTINNEFIIIDINGKIIQPEFYLICRDSYIIDVGSGTLSYEDEDDIWKYTANPALKTKPAAARE
jgi:hypothetical protein